MSSDLSIVLYLFVKLGINNIGGFTLGRPGLGGGVEVRPREAQGLGQLSATIYVTGENFRIL